MRIQLIGLLLGRTALGAILLGITSTGDRAQAQIVVPSSRSVTLFENVTLTPGFDPDPITVRGISGGGQPATTMSGRPETATGECVGFVDETPDHRMTLTEFFDYLRLEVRSSDDTTLVIRGPGGSWCSDDYAGINPGIAGQWFSGTYDIWVGSYRENSYHPYIIHISGTR
jgi:hypothetical protein